MNDKIKLRPHHSICFNLFVGEGYSDAFVENMKKIISLPSDTNVEIVFGCDDVCANCPNKKLDKCISQNKVNKLDEDSSRLCGFKEGQKLSLKTFKNIGLEKIIKTNNFEKVCKSCTYFDFCLKIRQELAKKIII